MDGAALKSFKYKNINSVNYDCFRQLGDSIVAKRKEISNRYQWSSKLAPGVVSTAIKNEINSIGGNAFAPTPSDCRQIIKGQTPRHM